MLVCFKSPLPVGTGKERVVEEQSLGDFAISAVAVIPGSRLDFARPYALYSDGCESTAVTIELEARKSKEEGQKRPK